MANGRNTRRIVLVCVLVAAVIGFGAGLIKRHPPASFSPPKPFKPSDKHD